VGETDQVFLDVPGLGVRKFLAGQGSVFVNRAQIVFGMERTGQLDEHVAYSLVVRLEVLFLEGLGLIPGVLADKLDIHLAEARTKGPAAIAALGAVDLRENVIVIFGDHLVETGLVQFGQVYHLALDFFVFRLAFVENSLVFADHGSILPETGAFS